MAHVYALLDPRDGSAFYVGATSTTIGTRSTNHHVEARRGGTSRRHAKLREILECGLRAIPILLATVGQDRLGGEERRWCERLCAMGEPILNDRGMWGIKANPSIWTPELDALLGIEHDETVAFAAGVTRKAASYRRSVLGIAPSTKPQKRVPPPRTQRRITFSEEEIARLGQAPDHVVAADLGCSKFTVGTERRRRGIRSYAETTGNDGRFQ